MWSKPKERHNRTSNTNWFHLFVILWIFISTRLEVIFSRNGRELIRIREIFCCQVLIMPRNLWIIQGREIKRLVISEYSTQQSYTYFLWLYELWKRHITLLCSTLLYQWSMDLLRERAFHHAYGWEISKNSITKSLNSPHG
jgi:hypothetical protein